MLRRKVFQELLDWKQNPNGKCAVLSGQRQVGKTTIVEEFGKTYPHYVEINFMKTPSMKSLFEGDLDTDSLISRMKLYFDPSFFEPGSTLILLDEIQECDAARTSLKFFAQDGRYDVIATGSLMGVKDLCRKDEDEKRPTSVGFERTIEMKGMDFEEFLWATGVQQESIDFVKEMISSFREIPAAYLDVFQSRFRDYMVVGGMPESVQTFVDTKDYSSSRRVLLDLVSSAKGDINKYNRGVDIIKTTECYDSIPSQLDNTNRKFMYSRINGEGSRKSAEKYRNNLLWIKAAGHGIFCNSLYGLGKPLKHQVDEGSFRVYLSDTGTLANLYGIPSVRAILARDYSFNMGAVAENAVAECLVKSGLEIYYYHNTNGKNRGEIDFIIESDGGLVAIEVKSGKKRSCPSIKTLDNPSVVQKVMFREGNNSEESDGIRGYPLFASAFIRSIVVVSEELPKADFPIL